MSHPYDFQDLRRFERLLLRKKKLLVGNLSQLEEEALRAAEEEVSVDSMADHGTDSFQRGLALDLIQNEEETVRRIDHALDRIHDGSYGSCERCEAVIPRERLRIVPHARFCVACQEKLEPKDRG